MNPISTPKIGGAASVLQREGGKPQIESASARATLALTAALWSRPSLVFLSDIADKLLLLLVST